MHDERLDLGALARAARARVAKARTAAPAAPVPPPPPEPPPPPARRRAAEVADEPAGSILVRADRATWVRPTGEPARSAHLPPRSVRTRRGHG